MKTINMNIVNLDHLKGDWPIADAMPELSIQVDVQEIQKYFLANGREHVLVLKQGDEYHNADDAHAFLQSHGFTETSRLTPQHNEYNFAIVRDKPVEYSLWAGDAVWKDSK